MNFVFVKVYRVPEMLLSKVGVELHFYTFWVRYVQIMEFFVVEIQWLPVCMSDSRFAEIFKDSLSSTSVERNVWLVVEKIVEFSHPSIANDV